MAANPMTCNLLDVEIDQRLESGVADLSAEAQLHLKKCRRCQLLYGQLQDESALGPSELNRRVFENLRASLTPVKPLPGFSACVMQSLGLFVIASGIMAAIMGTSGISYMNAAQLVAVTLLLGGAAVLGSFLFAKQMAPATIQWLPTWLGAGLFAALVVILNVAAFSWREPGTGVTVSWECLYKVLAIATPGAVIFRTMLRRAAVLSASAKGAAIGAMAGLLGVTVLQFGCVHQQAMHLLLWHWSAVALAAGAGAVAGRLSRAPFTSRA